MLEISTYFPERLKTIFHETVFKLNRLTFLTKITSRFDHKIIDIFASQQISMKSQLKA
jgi:hypothetical protein